MTLLKDQVVLITGAARGQGRAHALASARQGANVALLDLPGPVGSVGYPLSTRDQLEATAEEVRALGVSAIAIAADIRSSVAVDAAVAQVVAELGGIDAVVANAGIWGLGPFWQLTDEAWEEMLAINLTGTFKTVRAVTPHLISRGAGSIVLVSSVDGMEAGIGYAHYTAAKHGVLGLMKSVALELARFGVRCNAVAPGAVDTPMLDNPVAFDMAAGRAGGTRADLVAGCHHGNPMRGVSLLDPEDVADAAVFLNSHLARRVTGLVLTVDAGHMLLKGYEHDPQM
jgi:SDR family mycofactocin-dependent oxidoreductase